MHNPSEKYVLFRNYMTNELGITRADIEAWTKESVAVEVNKKLGQINVEAMVSDAIQRTANAAVGMNGGYNQGRELREAIATKLADQIMVTAKAKQQP